MDSGELRTRCLGLPGASEEFPFGDEVSVFKVGGKMFALCSLDTGPPGQGACEGLRAPSTVSTRRMSSAVV
jgi:predicted DNA-binding protein (MmcQ/YjbR family)